MTLSRSHAKRTGDTPPQDTTEEGEPSVKPKLVMKPRPSMKAPAPIDENDTRLLISPRSSYNFVISFLKKQIALDGSIVVEKGGALLSLTGSKTAARAAGREDVQLKASVRTPVCKITITAQQASELDVQPGPVQFSGSALLLDKGWLLKLDLKDETEEEALRHGRDTPLDAWDLLQTKIIDSYGYGNVMAFADDELAVRGLLPQFLKDAKQGQLNIQDAFDYIALEAQGMT